ncbi:MAG: hypothetical protein VX152_10410, partial [Pseudomonadota bacterium]|nr:hypothetical protein [Pseudomonadota bacterium]
MLISGCVLLLEPDQRQGGLGGVELLPPTPGGAPAAAALRARSAEVEAGAAAAAAAEEARAALEEQLASTV